MRTPKDTKKIRKLLVVLITLLTLYAPVELTRVILKLTELEPQYIFEIVFIWTLYCLGIIVTYLSIMLRGVWWVKYYLSIQDLLRKFLSSIFQ